MLTSWAILRAEMLLELNEHLSECENQGWGLLALVYVQNDEIEHV